MIGPLSAVKSVADITKSTGVPKVAVEEPALPGVLGIV